MNRAMRTRRLYALVAAATAVVEAPDVPAGINLLAEALEPYDLPSLLSEVAYADREDARRHAEADKVEAGERAFAELPDAPPRMQCEVEVARDMGRWTDFGRCEKAANRIVMDYDNHRERCLCAVHAKAFVTTGKMPTISGWTKTATRESWYRIKGWCMAPDPKQDPRKPRSYCKVKVEIGTGRHEGREHKFQ